MIEHVVEYTNKNLQLIKENGMYESLDYPHTPPKERRN
jgi:hypothetical protein